MYGPDPHGGMSLDRRQFLARIGVLGAGLTLAGGPLGSLARAADPAQELTRVAAAIMRAVATDTYKGLVAFQLPGPDAYSKAQGVTSPTPGGVDAKAHQAIMESADYFLPLPDDYAQAMAAAFVNGVSDQPLSSEALAQFGLVMEQQAVTLDRALQALLGNDGAVPLSLLFALTLNFEAGAVNPASLFGPFYSSPFANLKWADKAKVFERIERADTDLVATLDGQLPESLRNELSGTLKFVGGTLLEFAGFTTYCEFGVFDPKTRTLSGRPVGWDISHYLPGRTEPLDGTSDFLGYYRHHRSAAGRAPKYRRSTGRKSRA